MIATYLPGLSFLFIFVVVPLGVLFYRGIVASLFAGVAVDSYFWQTVSFTYLQAGISTVCAGILGFALAFLNSEQTYPLKKIFWRVTLFPMVLPGILVAVALIGVWGKSGWLLSQLGTNVPLFGWMGVLLAHTFLNAPIFAKNCTLALQSEGRVHEKTALSLGASRWCVFWEITLRRVGPALRTSALLSFLYCSSSFIIILLLGGGPKFTTLEVLVYEATKIDFDLPFAARLAAFQAGVGFILFALMLSSRRETTDERTAEWQPLFELKGFLRGLFFVILGVVWMGVFFFPIATLMVNGLLQIKHLLTVEAFRIVIFSVLLAVLTGLVSVSVAFSLALFEKHAKYRAHAFLVAWLASLPLCVSAILFSLAIILSYGKYLTGLRGDLLPIVLVQSLGILPFLFRTIRDSLSQIPATLYRSAKSLGASQMQILTRVEFPMMKRALLGAFLTGALYSLGELGAVIMFVGEQILNLPQWIYRLMNRYDFQQSEAVGLLLFVLAFGLATFVERFDAKRE